MFQNVENLRRSRHDMQAAERELRKSLPATTCVELRLMYTYSPAEPPLADDGVAIVPVLEREHNILQRLLLLTGGRGVVLVARKAEPLGTVHKDILAFETLEVSEGAQDRAQGLEMWRGAVSA